MEVWVFAQYGDGNGDVFGDDKNYFIISPEI